MRKKPTYGELANSTLAQSVLKPNKIPYNLPNDNTTAVAEFKRMLEEDEIRQIIGEEYRASTTAAARESGLPREYFEKLAERIMTDGSNLHNETRKQSQDAAAAAARLRQLHTDALLQGHAATQQGIQRNIDMQQQVGESLKSMPSNITAAVLAAMQSSGAASSTPTSPPPPPPPATAPEDIPVESSAAAADTSDKTSAAADTSDKKQVGHHEPGAHKPATNIDSKTVNQAAVTAAAVAKKAQDIKERRDKLIAEREAQAKEERERNHAEMMKKVATEGLNNPPQPGTPTTIPELSAEENTASLASIKRQEASSSSAAASSAAPASSAATADDKGKHGQGW